MLFLVKGVDYAGQSFSSRFESASEEVLRDWMVENGITLTGIRALPFTTGPYSKFPWLILAFPILVALLVFTSAKLVGIAALGESTTWPEGILISVLDGIWAILIYNIMLRLGSQYDFGGEGVVQYAKGDCVTTSKDVEDDEEMGD